MFSGQLYDYTNGGSFSVGQFVQVTAGSTYRFVGYYNIPTTSDAFSLRVDVSWATNAGTTVGTSSNVMSRTTHTSGAWASMVKTGRYRPQEQQRLSFITANSMAAKAYFDQFYFGQ